MNAFCSQYRRFVSGWYQEERGLWGGNWICDSIWVLRTQQPLIYFMNLFIPPSFHVYTVSALCSRWRSLGFSSTALRLETLTPWLPYNFKDTVRHQPVRCVYLHPYWCLSIPSFTSAIGASNSFSISERENYKPMSDPLLIMSHIFMGVWFTLEYQTDFSGHL